MLVQPENSSAPCNARAFFVHHQHPRSPIRFTNLPDDAIEALLEPADGLLAGDAVAGTDPALAAAALGDALTGAGHAAVEVNAVDTDAGIVLDAEIDVFGDTEAEVASLGEVAAAKLIFLDLQATLQNLLGLGAADSDVDSNLFVTADTELTDGVTSLAWSEGLISRP